MKNNAEKARKRVLVNGGCINKKQYLCSFAAGFELAFI
jgi:hypothetical protein